MLKHPSIPPQPQFREPFEQPPKERSVRPAHFGVDVDVLMGTVNAIKNDVELGVSRFRVTNTWLAGNHNRSMVTGFFGARREIAHRQAFARDADESGILAGNDNGANPVERLLHALASCLTTSMVAHAAVRGIAIRSIESSVEGEIDRRGFLGLSPRVSKDCTAIRAAFRIDADPKDFDRIRELAEFSPVFNTLSQGTSVVMTVDAK